MSRSGSSGPARGPVRKVQGTGKGSGKGPTLIHWLVLALFIIVADQATKVLILGSFAWGDTVPVTGFFNLVRVHNTGAAFSFLAGASGWQRWFFVGLGTLASIVIVWMLRRHAQQTLFCWAITLILGGAIGNVIDRLVHGYVVDMLDFYWGTWHFPAFNLADSAITLGACSLILDEFLRVRRGK